MPKTAKPKYPECEKLSTLDAKRRTAHDFLEWLTENGMEVGARNPHSDRLEWCGKNDEALVFAWLGIDAKKLEHERRAMLEAAGGGS